MILKKYLKMLLKKIALSFSIKMIRLLLNYQSKKLRISRFMIDTFYLIL